MSQFASKPLDLDYQSFEKRKNNLIGFIIDQYRVTKLLGKGNFSSVYQAESDKGNKFALKVLNLREIANESNTRVKQIRERLAESEPKLMMQCDSPNLLKCYDIYENKDLKLLIMEYCSGETLEKYLGKKRKLTEQQAVDILRQIINGVAVLHEHKIVHRDLKTENIMEHQGQYKIIDFGFSKKLEIANQSEQIKNTLLGTPTTMAPEVFLRKNYGLKADIWSIGIIFFEMVFGVQPYDSRNAKTFYNQIERRFDSNKPQSYNGVTLSSNAHNFLKNVLIVDTEKRIGWRELIEHPLIKVKAEEPLPERFILRTSLIEPQVDRRLVQEDLISVNFQLPEQRKLQIKEQLPLRQEKREIVPERVPERVIAENRIKEQIAGEKKAIEQARKIVQQLESVRFTGYNRREINKVEDARNQQDFKKCKEMHLACLKTEFIFNNIFCPIETHNLIDLNTRQAIELAVLLLSRCFRNMSPLKEWLKSNPANIHKAAKNLDQQIVYLYERVKVKFQEYDNRLREKENKVLQICKDFAFKIFSKKTQQTKNVIMGGIQAQPQKQFGDFTFQQQITYTCQFIDKMMPKIVEMGTVSAKVKKFLIHYSSIACVTMQELKDQSFAQYVRRITS